MGFVWLFSFKLAVQVDLDAYVAITSFLALCLKLFNSAVSLLQIS